jgi:itaconate CoA-transferase
MNLEGFEGRMDAIPSVGQHTDEILAELGYDAQRIAELHALNAL